MLPCEDLKTKWVANWRPDFIGTLVFLVCQSEILLIRKKTGHGKGQINVPGGKIEPGETAQQCAIREMREEVGIYVRDPDLCAEVRFVDLLGPQWLGLAFLAQDYEGELRETLEALPFWCQLESIPYKEMWESDKYWFPKVLDKCGQINKEPFVLDVLSGREGLLDVNFY